MENNNNLSRIQDFHRSFKKEMAEGLLTENDEDLDIDGMEVDHQTSILDLNDDCLVKIFAFVGQKPQKMSRLQKLVHREEFIWSDTSLSLDDMHRTRLVCHRFNNVLLEHWRHLPKVPIALRIKGDKNLLPPFVSGVDKVTMYIYGKAGNARPTRFVSTKNISGELFGTVIRSNLNVSGVWLTDDLIDALLALNLSEVEEVHFTDILGVLMDENTKSQKIVKLLLKMCNAMEVSFTSSYFDVNVELLTDDVKKAVAEADQSLEVNELEDTAAMKNRKTHKFARNKAKTKRDKNRALCAVAMASSLLGTVREEENAPRDVAYDPIGYHKRSIREKLTSLGEKKRRQGKKLVVKLTQQLKRRNIREGEIKSLIKKMTSLTAEDTWSAAPRLGRTTQ